MMKMSLPRVSTQLSLPAPLVAAPLVAVALAGALLLGACASTGAGLSAVSPATTLTLAAKAGAPSRSALGIAEKLYGGEASPEELEQALAALPAHERDSAVAHEVAGYLAVLRADTDAAWEHFLRAAQDPAAPLAEVYLEEAMSFVRTASQVKTSIAFLKQLAARHPSGSVRARAALFLIDDLRLHDRLDEVPAARTAIGFIDAWRIAGSFDNDQGKGFLTAYPPEAGVDISATMQGARLPIGWRDIDLSAHDGSVPLGWTLSPAAHAAAYLVTWAHVEKDSDVELRLTVSGGVRAWVNGRLAISEERIDRHALDNLRARVRLTRGWNEILVKSTTTTGRWELGARITDESGAPLEGIRFATDPKTEPRTAELGADVEVMKVPAGVLQAAGDKRRAFFEGRASQLMGHVRPAVEGLQRFVEQHPKSLPGIYYAAIALWQDDEQGRALDLINSAVRLTDERVPRLLQKRAELYEEKGLYDKAQADLMKVREHTKRARSAEVELSQVLAKRGFHVDRCRVLDDVLARWPDDAWSMREAGLCWQARGYKARALELYRSAAALEPGQSWGLEQLKDVAIERAEIDDALTLVRTQQRLFPERLSYVLDEGDLLRWRGDKAGAKERYERAVKHSPDWARPRDALGELAREQGNEELALDHLRAAYERNPEDTRLADLLDFLEPKGLGLAERYAPGIEEIEAALARAKEVTPKPGAQVLVLVDDEVAEVSQEGSAKRVVTSVSMPLNKQGRDELIQARVPTSGKVRILHAYSVQPDGERQEASSIRNGVVRFRSLDVGSAVVLQYVHYARPQAFLPNHYVADWYFQGMGRHVDRSRWVLIVPKDRKLSVAVHGDVKQTTEEVGGLLARTFLAEDVPPLLPERFMPNPRDRLWRASVSTVSGWEEYARWERALLSQVFRTDADTAALAKKLTEGAKTPREKFDRLYHFAAQEIRYQQDYENTIAGVRPHACPVVLSRGYGDCKDKAVLLILLAKQVGIDVDFAILRTTDAGKVQRDVPNQQFNHAIVYVPEQEGISPGFFMDPTTDGLDMGNLRGDDQGAISLVLDPESGEHRFLEIPYSPPSMERSTYRFDVDVSSAKRASATFSLESRGATASSVRQLMRNPEQAKKFYQGITMAMFPGALALDVKTSDHEDIWSPLRLDLEADVSPSLQKQGDDVRLPLPGVFPLNATATLAERQHPIRLGPPDSYKTELKVTLPAGSRVTHLPEDVSVQDACFSVTRTATRKLDEVNVAVEYTRTCAEISVEEYGRYRDNVQRAQSQLSDPLLFRAAPSPLAQH